MVNLSLILLGAGVLVWGARITLTKAILIAQHHRVSDFVFGTLILAIGTDLPELAVSVRAAVHSLTSEDMSGLIIGNTLGSCFGQIGLTLGIAGLIGYLSMPRETVLRHGQVLLGSMLVLFLCGLDAEITRIEGAVLIAMFILYLVMVLGEPRTSEQLSHTQSYPITKTWILLAAGLLMIVGSSEVIVRAAVDLAAVWGVSQSFIGIAIVGIGTSLPELSVSIAALRQARGGMAVGNIVGSNILDVLLPVGLAAVINPVHFEQALLWIDLPLLSLLTIMALAFFLVKRRLRKGQALCLVAFYAGYMLFKVLQAG